jgi:hypothetical protein
MAKGDHGGAIARNIESLIFHFALSVSTERAAHAVTTPRKHTARSKVTNGTRILDGIERSAIARRYTDLVAVVCADQGGRELMSEAKMQLARRFAALSVQLEGLETRLANGEDIDIAEYSQLTSTLVRVVSRLGLERVPKDVGMTLGDLLRLRQ